MNALHPDGKPHANLRVGVVITGLAVAVAVLSFVWTPHDPEAVMIAEKLLSPSLCHPFGTDHLGRDTLSMIMAGTGTSLGIGLLAVAIGVLVGVPLGLAGAIWSGPVDEASMRITDLVFSFPALLTAVLLTALTGPGAGNVVLALGIFNIAVFARVIHGAAHAVMARPFILAATAMGRTRLSIAWHHLLPNISGPVLVQATIQFAVAILAEAGLSFLGLGVQPPTPSWGKMLADAQTFMFLNPWQAVFPGLAIALVVLGLNLLGDGLRDRLDPKYRLLRAAAN